MSVSLLNVQTFFINLVSSMSIYTDQVSGLYYKSVLNKFKA